MLAPLKDALRERGYIEGQTVEFEVRAAGGDFDSLSPLAAELVGARVDIILAVGEGAIQAARRESNTVPIVMSFGGGPGLVESGTVASFARPATNVTGVFMLAVEIERKRLELLVDAVPNARRIAMLTPDAESRAARLAELRPIADAAMVELLSTAVAGTDDYEAIFNDLAGDRIDAVLVPSSPRFYLEQAKIIDAAARHRVPAMYEWGDMARAGGLIAYGPVFLELVRRVAAFVDQILRGAKVGSIPVEQPTKFELVINLRTAKGLGITIPQSLLLRADEVIQ
jgi:putative ABC transport system substrate-binding protein